jgi:hypothetical protein
MNGSRTPEELAESWGWSPRRLRALVYQIGAGHKLGNKIILLDEDVTALKEATKLCPSKSSGEKAQPSGTTGGPLMDTDYAGLVEQRTRRSRRELRRKRKAGTGNVVWMDRNP